MCTRFSAAGYLVVLLLTWLPAQVVSLNQQPDDIKVDPSGEIKIFNDLFIAEDEVRSGAIRVIGGDLKVAGTVTGRITVLGGDVELLSTARIEGTIVAIGGVISRSEEAEVTGDVFEVNRGKISLSRDESEAIFGRKDSREERLDRSDDEYDEDYEYEWDTAGVNHDYTRQWRSNARRQIRPDFEVFDDVTLRYNRSEGLALYFPFNPDTDDIPGFHVYGYFGRAIGAGRWFYRLGVGEYFFKGRLGLLVEGHREPRHDDGWRVSSLENSLGAFFLHKDWHDWYETEGYGGSVVLAQPGIVELKVRYRDEKHRMMPNATDWSLSNRTGEFSDPYDIAEKQDANLSYQVTLGYPAGFFPRHIQGNLAYTYTQTYPGGEDDATLFDYTKEDVALETFIPLHRRLGVRVKARTGSVKGDYGLQHMVPLGGIGSIQGYAYKTIAAGDHYAVVNATFSLRNRRSLFSLFWHYGNTWNSTDRLLTGDYFSDVQDGGHHGIGLGLGDDDVQIELFRTLDEGSNWITYLRILEF
jgi:hypothetical protein